MTREKLRQGMFSTLQRIHHKYYSHTPLAVLLSRHGESVSKCTKNYHSRQGRMDQEERRSHAQVGIFLLTLFTSCRWSTRYFALVGPSLTYKLKQDSPSLRGTFDLVPGCILTDVNHISSYIFELSLG